MQCGREGVEAHLVGDVVGSGAMGVVQAVIAGSVEKG